MKEISPFQFHLKIANNEKITEDNLITFGILVTFLLKTNFPLLHPLQTLILF